MKLLISNSIDKTLLAPQYALSLKNLGYEVFDYFQSDYFYEFGIFSKIIHRLYPHFFYKKVNNDLLNLVKQINPDILFIFKGMETFPRTLLKIKSMGVKLVNYNPDHPFKYVSRGSGNSNVLNSIPIFDLHITYSHKISQDLKEMYPAVRTEVLPFGYNLSDSDFIEIEKTDEINRVCFVGYADEERAEFLKYLINSNIKVDIYGEKWNKFFKESNQNHRIYPSVKGLEYYKTLRKYRVQLNLFRKHNENSHNMRSFEVPASGGIMLAPNSLEHQMYFENEKEVFLFNSKHECLDMIQFLMSSPENIIKEIRINARNRSVMSKYSYEERSRQLQTILMNVLK